MRRRSREFTVYTAGGRGTYRSRARADSAARWVARDTGESVTVMDDATGERWEITAERTP